MHSKQTHFRAYMSHLRHLPSFLIVLICGFLCQISLAEQSNPQNSLLPIELLDMMSQASWEISRPLNLPQLKELKPNIELVTRGEPQRIVTIPNQEALFMSTEDASLFKFGIPDRKVRWSYKIPSAVLRDTVLSSRGDFSIVAGDAGLLGVVTISDSPSFRRFPRSARTTFSRVALQAQELLFASADLNGQVEVARVDTGEVLWTVRAHEWPVLGLAFSSDGEFLFTADTREILLWNVNSGKVIRRFVPGDGTSGHWFNAFAFSKDRNLIVASTVGKVFIFDVRSQSVVRTFESPNQLPVWLEPFSDNTKLGLAQRNRVVKIIDIESASVLGRYRFQSSFLEFPQAGTITSDGKTLVIVTIRPNSSCGRDDADCRDNTGIVTLHFLSMEKP